MSLNMIGEGCISLEMKGGRVHVTRYDWMQGACHWIRQEAGGMSLELTGGREHATVCGRRQGACYCT